MATPATAPAAANDDVGVDNNDDETEEADPSAGTGAEATIVAPEFWLSTSDPFEKAVDAVDRHHLKIWGADEADDPIDEVNEDVDRAVAAKNGDSAPNFLLSNGARMTIATNDSFYGSEADPSAEKK